MKRARILPLVLSMTLGLGVVGAANLAMAASDLQTRFTAPVNLPNGEAPQGTAMTITVEVKNNGPSLGTVTGSTPVGRAWSAPLAATGLSLEATPKAVDGGTIAVEVRLLRGGSAVVTSTVRLAPGGQVLVGGPTIPSGRLIVALTGR